LSPQRPALKGRNPADFVNVSFLKKPEDEGFFVFPNLKQILTENCRHLWLDFYPV